MKSWTLGKNSSLCIVVSYFYELLLAKCMHFLQKGICVSELECVLVLLRLLVCLHVHLCYMFPPPPQLPYWFRANSITGVCAHSAGRAAGSSAHHWHHWVPIWPGDGYLQVLVSSAADHWLARCLWPVSWKPPMPLSTFTLCCTAGLSTVTHPWWCTL